MLSQLSVGGGAGSGAVAVGSRQVRSQGERPPQASLRSCGSGSRASRGVGIPLNFYFLYHSSICMSCKRAAFL